MARRQEGAGAAIAAAGSSASRQQGQSPAGPVASSASRQQRQSPRGYSQRAFLKRQARYVSMNTIAHSDSGYPQVHRSSGMVSKFMP